LEDLRSRNHTWLNGKILEGRDELRNGDQVKVCDLVFEFHRQLPLIDPAALPQSDSDSTLSVESGSDPQHHRQEHTVSAGMPVPVEDQDTRLQDPSEDSSSIISRLDVRSDANLRLDVKPEAKLRAVLEIGRAIGNVLDLDAVLHQTLEKLFQIYPQADEGFVMLYDLERKKLIVKATRSRDAAEPDSVSVSMTIVRQALKTGEAILSHNAIEDQRFKLSESVSALQIRSMMCVPLLGQDGQALGVFQIATKNLKQQFAKDDLDTLAAIASQVSLAVENARLHKELLEQRDMHRDLDIARQVQLGFLPDRRPRLEGFEFYDYYEAAIRVGGDYFDYIHLPNGRVAVALGDVAGKGVPAALLMARLYSSARFHLLTRPTLP
ncbi:MAG: GAF domain-containing protein, partial [Planctomycetaceae bacterium]